MGRTSLHQKTLRLGFEGSGGDAQGGDGGREVPNGLLLAATGRRDALDIDKHGFEQGGLAGLILAKALHDVAQPAQGCACSPAAPIVAGMVASAPQVRK